MHIVYDPDPRAGATLYRYYGDWRWDPTPPRLIPSSDRRVAVIDGRSRISGTWDPKHRQFYSNGTVARGQRRGTATRMWGHLISTLQPMRVVMDVVTDAGWAMAASLRRQHPGVRWSVSDMR